MYIYIYIYIYISEASGKWAPDIEGDGLQDPLVIPRDPRSLSRSLSIYLSISLSIYLSISLSLYLSTHTSLGEKSTYERLMLLIPCGACAS